MRRAAAALVLVLAPALGAQSAPPDTDVWLAPLARRGDTLVIGAPRNVTRRPGYDNQPSFTPDGRAVLYSAVVGGQTDIFRHELASGRTTQLTRTPESEYSPTMMPGGQRFSVVRVERDSTQRLWSFAPDGSDPRLLLSRVKPVGYHAWVGDSTVALYVLGEPATLQLAHPDGRLDTLTSGIGRALVRWRDTAVVAVRRAPEGGFTAFAVQAARPLAPDDACALPLPSGTEFLALIHDRVLVGMGSELRAHADAPLRCDAASAASSGGWQRVADLSAHGLRNITRLAVSPDGRWLAFVAEPASLPVRKSR